VGNQDFRFKQFAIVQNNATHKVGTDGVLLGAWVDIADARLILDIGTGTGLIALMLAQRSSAYTFIDAVELQVPDAAQARENVSRSPWTDRVTIHCTDIKDFATDKKYDLIVSNPPFFKDSYLPPSSTRATVRHTSDLPFEILIEKGKDLLSSSGRLAVILPANEGNHFMHLCSLKGLHALRVCSFRSRQHKPVERLLMEFSFQAVPMTKEDLVLYDSNGEWSDGYKKMTKEFYLNI
jgi:tRNA1Val (adenine37-N6)-methyltransferase